MCIRDSFGGEEFIFFSPVFNFADACISVGVVLMLLFCRKDMEGIGDTFRRGLQLKVTSKETVSDDEQDK